MQIQRGNFYMAIKKIQVGISLLSSDFFNIKDTIKTINKSPIDFVHLDVMDGVFVPNISFGSHFIKTIRPHTKKVFDVHLMIQNPYNYICDFVNAGADIITVHHEAKNAIRSLKLIKSLGVKCGIAINPETSPSCVKKYLDIVDLIMVMTVHPGFGGQQFISSQLKSISKISELISTSNHDIGLQVDGGINFDTAKLAIHSGATSLVSGSFLLNQPDIAKAVNKFKKL